MLPETGKISMKDVAIELNKQNSPISLSDEDVKELTDKQINKTISFSDLKGKSNWIYQGIYTCGKEMIDGGYYQGYYPNLITGTIHTNLGSLSPETTMITKFYVDKDKDGYYDIYMHNNIINNNNMILLKLDNDLMYIQYDDTTNKIKSFMFNKDKYFELDIEHIIKVKKYTNNLCKISFSKYKASQNPIIKINNEELIINNFATGLNIYVKKGSKIYLKAGYDPRYKYIEINNENTRKTELEFIIENNTYVYFNVR